MFPINTETFFEKIVVSKLYSKLILVALERLASYTVIISYRLFGSYKIMNNFYTVCEYYMLLSSELQTVNYAIKNQNSVFSASSQ